MKSLLLVWLAFAAFGQTTVRKSLLGTVAGFKAETTEVIIKPESGEPQPVKFGPGTIVQRIAPGEKDLKSAETIDITAVGIGDRVLVSFAASEPEALRIVVMPLNDIARRNEADKQDWILRGVAGTVLSKKGNQLTLRMRSLRGETTITVTVTGETKYRRYAPDSVKFADAMTSGLQEIGIGDQLRARGAKSPGGSDIQAEEVVFGTFLSRAGTVTAVNAEAGEITAKDLDGKKLFVVRVTTDSQVKKMPAFTGPGPRAFGGPTGPGQAPPDLNQMIERMPQVTIAEVKVGDTIVASSTKGAKNDQLTAIMLLTNAGTLIQMASAQQQNNPRGAAASGGIGTGGGIGMGLGGLDLSGMVP